MHPTFLVFGVIVAVAGLVMLLTRKYQGRYAYQTWMGVGAKGMAQSPEFWAKASIVGAIVFWIVAAVCIVSAFLP